MTDANCSDVDVGTDPGPVIRSREAGDSPSESVIRAVSEATGTDPLQMPRLGNVIDPDALDALFFADSAWAESDGDDGGTVSFRFGGCDVTVHADGRTVVSRTAEASP
jgi:hypothetical protein